MHKLDLGIGSDILLCVIPPSTETIGNQMNQAGCKYTQNTIFKSNHKHLRISWHFIAFDSAEALKAFGSADPEARADAK